MNPVLGIALVLGWFCVLFAMLRLAAQRYDVHPEVSRKLAHIGMGLATVSFPWIFHEVWPVWVLCAGFLLSLAALRWIAPLQFRFGKILGGIERQSWGEFHFTLAVAIVFTFTRFEPVWYVIPVLVLTLADALAALVGLRYGKTRYYLESDWKSFEGSLAFFVAASVSTMAASCIMTHEPLPRILVTSICVGVLAALVEAMFWGGLDNLFLPLATLLMLIRFAEARTPDLLSRVIVALALLGFVVGWRHRTTLRHDALIGATLMLYLFWTIGGWLWLQPPLLLALAYPLLPFRPQRISPEVHGNFVVIALGSVGFLWIFLDQTLNQADYRMPYVLSFTCQLAMIFVARWKRGHPAGSTFLLIVGAVCTSWAIIFLPAVFLLLAPGSVRVAALALLVTWLVTSAFCSLQRPVADMPNTFGRWLLQTSLTLAGSSLGLLPLFRR